MHQLIEVLAEQRTKQVSDQTITVMARLFSLQDKERYLKAVQEWPIDISFLSKLIGLGLTPIMSKIAVEFFFLDIFRASHLPARALLYIALN